MASQLYNVVLCVLSVLDDICLNLVGDWCNFWQSLIHTCIQVMLLYSIQHWIVYKTGSYMDVVLYHIRRGTSPSSWWSDNVLHYAIYIFHLNKPAFVWPNLLDWMCCYFKLSETLNSETLTWNSISGTRKLISLKYHWSSLHDCAWFTKWRTRPNYTNSIRAISIYKTKQTFINHHWSIITLAKEGKFSMKISWAPISLELLLLPNQFSGTRNSMPNTQVTAPNIIVHDSQSEKLTKLYRIPSELYLHNQTKHYSSISTVAKNSKFSMKFFLSLHQQFITESSSQLPRTANPPHEIEKFLQLVLLLVCYYFPILEMSDSKAPTSAFTLLFLAMASFPAVSSITLLYSRRLRFFSSVFWCRSATAGTTNPPPPPAAAVPPMLPRLLRLLILRWNPLPPPPPLLLPPASPLLKNLSRVVAGASSGGAAVAAARLLLERMTLKAVVVVVVVDLLACRVNGKRTDLALPVMLMLLARRCDGRGGGDGGGAMPDFFSSWQGGLCGFSSLISFAAADDDDDGSWWEICWLISTRFLFGLGGFKLFVLVVVIFFLLLWEEGGVDFSPALSSGDGGGLPVSFDPTDLTSFFFDDDPSMTSSVDSATILLLPCGDDLIGFFPLVTLTSFFFLASPPPAAMVVFSGGSGVDSYATMSFHTTTPASPFFPVSSTAVAAAFFPAFTGLVRSPTRLRDDADRSLAIAVAAASGGGGGVFRGLGWAAAGRRDSRSSKACAPPYLQAWWQDPADGRW